MKDCFYGIRCRTHDLKRTVADNPCRTVDREEVDRLRKRFMKLDKVRLFSPNGTRSQRPNPRAFN